MNLIQAYQTKLQSFGIEFLSESDCDRILAQYAHAHYTRVECPYKPKTYLTKAEGNAGRSNVYVVGIGKIYYGDTPFEAKLNAVCGFLKWKYFALDAELQVMVLF